MTIEQYDELRVHLEELYGLLECETDLRGDNTVTANNLRASIAAVELELSATPCPACGQTADVLDLRTVAAFSTVTVCHVCYKVVG